MRLTSKQALEIIDQNSLQNNANLKKFIENNKEVYSFEDLSLILELSNNKRKKNSAYYTNFFIIQEIINLLPDFSKNEITILEPSVGGGNFLPFLFERYKRYKKVNLILIDIDRTALDFLSIIYDKNSVPDNFEISFICQDFLTFEKDNVDLIIGNPPFTKITKNIKKKYNKKYYSDGLYNLAGLFLERSLKMSSYVSLIMPKNLLNTPEYSYTRDLLQKNITHIYDFGEAGFKGVLIETINLLIDVDNFSKKVSVRNFSRKETVVQDKKYIFDKKLPYWVIYRNSFFDAVYKKLEFNVFNVFRDRQITNSNSFLERRSLFDIRVLKSRNINDQGNEIVDIQGYDSFISMDKLEKMAVSKYLNMDKVYLTPNMTYKPRVMKKPLGCVVNGSVAILIPKFDFELTEHQMRYFSTPEYRAFYKIARNYQTRSLNIDKSSVYWFGILRED